MANIRAMLAAREPLYAQAATVVDTAARTMGQSLDALRTLLAPSVPRGRARCSTARI
jgi:hypothetical protein